LIAQLCRRHRKRKAKASAENNEKPRFPIEFRLMHAQSDTTKAIIWRIKKLLAKARKTITMDNGTENAKHEKLTARRGVECFFAHSYSAWEQGSNEQMNGLIPPLACQKGRTSVRLTKEQIGRIESLINNRPRKWLGFKTPVEVARSFVALQS
jgi:IS30 family transposase